MAHPPPYPDKGDDDPEGTERGSRGTPRWVIVFWIVGIVLVLLFVALHLTGSVGPRGH